MRFQQERSDRNHALLERQTLELQDFDLQTTTMGLNAMEIVEATQDTFNDDEESVRGSVLSLTPSSSMNSFSQTAL